jgi:hypothetical protein
MSTMILRLFMRRRRPGRTAAWFAERCGIGRLNSFR